MRLDRRRRRDGIRRVVVDIDAGAEGGGPARRPTPREGIVVVAYDATVATTTNARIVVAAPPPPPFVVDLVPKRLRPTGGVRVRDRRVRDGTAGHVVVRNLGVRVRYTEGGGTRANERRRDDDGRVRVDGCGCAVGNVRPVRAGGVDTHEREGDGGAQDVGHGSGGEGERRDGRGAGGGGGGGEWGEGRGGTTQTALFLIRSCRVYSFIAIKFFFYSPPLYFGSFGFSGNTHTIQTQGTVQHQRQFGTSPLLPPDQDFGGIREGRGITLVSVAQFVS